MTDHTEGPWVARAPAAHKDQLRQHYWEIRKPNRRLATVYGDPNNPEIKANAHLIAAAPDLYEALKIAIGVFWDNNIDEAMADEFEILTDALAKARGEEE